MPSVSADNNLIAGNVQLIRDAYSGFLLGLRGMVVEILAGLNNGTKSLIAMDRDLKRFAEDRGRFLSGLIKTGLLEGSYCAIGTCEQKTGVSATENWLSVSDTLVSSFTGSIEDSIGRQMQRDVKAAEDFLRRQLMLGRTVATTDEIARELPFKHADKTGRQIDSIDYVSREVNWSYRTNYNTIMLFSASDAGVEEFKVDGGSKDGLTLTLDEYDKLAGGLFHHNSKALLQPNYSVS